MDASGFELNLHRKCGRAKLGGIVAVADAKYKPEPSTQDRYELLAFCEALGVTKAAFVCPLAGTEPLATRYGVTKAGRRIDLLRIDLAQTGSLRLGLRC